MPDGERDECGRAVAHCERLQCSWTSWDVHGPKHLAVFLPAGHCTNMAGAIRIAKALMPEVERIDTFSGEIPDVRYVLKRAARRSRWVAYDLRPANRPQMPNWWGEEEEDQP